MPEINQELLYTAADAVVSERHRQHEKWGEQRHSLEYWLAILVEEVGEFAQALQREKGDGKPTDADNRLTEIIQVSAVAMGIAEQLIEEIEGVATSDTRTDEPTEEDPEQVFTVPVEPEASGSETGT